MPAPLDYAARPLRRAIGLPGAVMLGLGAILGSGVFVGLPQATAIAGPWVLVSILLAGGLAFCNAMSSAQLAAAHPVSGGTYEYGYRYLSPAWGFAAGWTFLLAKSASAATAALGVADTLFRADAGSRDLGGLLMRGGHAASDHAVYSEADVLATMALIALLGVLALSLLGIRRTNAANIAIVAVTLAGLLAFAVRFAWHIHPSPLLQAARDSHASTTGAPMLAATALCFVAFTGYGRLATLGEEVREPARTIPRAIWTTLAIAVTIYLAVGFIVASVFVTRPSWQPVPTSLVEIATGLQAQWYAFIAPAAVTAMLGVLLNLVLGLSRVWLAMGRRGDMPAGLARVSERTGTPVPATIVSGIVIALLVLLGRDVKTTWSFSAFSVLIYYAITNLACLRLPADDRRFPRALAWIGLFACLSLAFFIELPVAAAGATLIGVGMLWHVWRRRAAQLRHPEGA